MKRTFILTVVLFACFGVVSAFAAETGKARGKQPGQAIQCPRSISVDVTMRTAAAVSGWDSIPARSKFTLSIKENVVRGSSMICHYSNGTVDYNIHKVFPKGKTCYIAPDQSFVCQ